MDKKVIITGSKGVIGVPVTAYFNEQGYDVCELDLTMGHDFTNEEFVIEWFKENKANYLVNLFALNDHIRGSHKEKKSAILEISLDSLRDYMEVNITALFSVCREFARNNDKGSIVNFSSIYGLVSPRPEMYDGDEKHIGYSVTKAAVIHLTKHLAVHFAPDIRVNCVAPGGVENAQSGSFQDKYAENTPMKRMMQKEELNGILKYLCSEDSTYTIGATFVIDGGWSIV